MAVPYLAVSSLVVGGGAVVARSGLLAAVVAAAVVRAAVTVVVAPSVLVVAAAVVACGATADSRKTLFKQNGDAVLKTGKDESLRSCRDIMSKRNDNLEHE